MFSLEKWKKKATIFTKVLFSYCFVISQSALTFRTEALAQNLYMNSRLSSSLYGGSAWEMSPRRRRQSLSQSFEQLEGVSSSRGTTPHTPYSPSMDEDSVNLLFDVKLVLVQFLC